MKIITLNEVIKAVNGKFNGNLKGYINQVYYDSREVNDIKENNSLFVAIKGNQVDGHDFVCDALKSGADYAMVEYKPVNMADEEKLIFVEDTVKALDDLAVYYRSLFKLKFIGVTGSVGKTHCKEFIANVLSQKFKTFRNKGNLNSLIGLPIALFDLHDKYEIAVMELATNHFGEIKVLSKIVKPDISVITNVEEVHTEFLCDLKGVFQEKTDIFRFSKSNSTKIFNGDRRLFDIYQGRKRYYSYGLNVDNDYVVKKIKLCGNKYSFYLNDKKFKIPSDFKPNIFNAIPAIIIGKLNGLSNKQINAGLSIKTNLELRINKRYNKKKNWEIIADCYNANPKAVKAGIKYLLQSNYNHKIVILGDMLELGKNEINKHQEIGDFLKRCRIHTAISVGNLAKHFDADTHFNSIEELINSNKILNFPTNSAILLKGSRFIELEKLIERLID